MEEKPLYKNNFLKSSLSPISLWFINKLNNQDFMGLGWRNDVESLAVEDQDISVRARSDISKEEDNLEKNMTSVVPDEHSETGMRSGNGVAFRSLVMMNQRILLERFL
ncbi:Uncharacterized protein Rs2_21954 [Raphanus sativus]|nr:Uncharacterized protein Rs2_21954 [Raphanus sativus]